VSSRPARLIGLSAAGALVLGTLVVPQALAAGDDPVFVSDAATPLAVVRQGLRPARASAHAASRPVPGSAARAKVTVSKNEQILQRFSGVKGSASALSPATSVAAGTQQVMQVGTAEIQLFTKSTGARLGTSTNLEGFFHVTAANTTVSDPTVAFDLIGKRWVLVGVATDDQGTGTAADDEVGIVVRVSKGATLKWGQKSWRAPFGYAETDDVTESTPRIGVSGDKVVVTADAVDANDASVANRIFVLPKDQLYKATVSGPNAWVSSVNNTYDGQTPSVNASGGNAAFVAVPDTSDFTVYTLSGQAKANPPVFSKSVMYPTIDLVDAPDVPQTGGGDIRLPTAIDSASVSWRKGVLWAVLTVGCTPSGDTTLRPCLRVLKVTTSSGVSLESEETRASNGRNWFSAGVAIDGSGLPHVVFNFSSGGGPVGSAVMARKSNGSWTAAKVVAKGAAAFDDGAPGPTVGWAAAGAAAPDPSSPWDVWVSEGFANAAGAPNWGSNVARVSLATNVAKVKASKTAVPKGSKVTFTASLKRPQSSDAVKGLPVSLQARPKGSSKWKTVGNAKTNGSGKATWTLKVSKTTDYRTYGKAVKQSGGQGPVVAAVSSKSVRVTAR
jgi:hypothetical protein